MGITEPQGSAGQVDNGHDWHVGLMYIVYFCYYVLQVFHMSMEQYATSCLHHIDCRNAGHNY